MSFEFKFPDVGEGIVEGKLIKWLVKPGDAVRQDQNVAEVETDKAVVEIPSPKAGTIEKLFYQQADTIPVGKTMMLIAEAGAPAAPAGETKQRTTSYPPAVQPTPTPQAPAQQASTSSFQPQRITTSNILAMPAVRKHAQEKGIDLALVPATGKEGNITLEDVDRYLGGKLLPRAQTSAPAPQRSVVQPASIPQPPLNIAQPNRDVLATPSTRQYARELGVDITAVNGSGAQGQVTRDDVERALGKKPQSTPPLSAALRARTSTPAQQDVLAQRPAAEPGKEVLMPLSARRVAIAKRMTESFQTAVTVMLSDEADLTDLAGLREREKEKLAKQGIKLTYLPFFIKAAVLCLEKYPIFNAELDIWHNQTILKQYYNIGVATDTEDGLIVPVIKDADRKSIAKLAQEIGLLSQRARENKLTKEEITGGTFTITNLGSIGGLAFTTVLNHPEVAILGIGKLADKPAVRDGKVEVRKLCTLSLGYDHRLIDGADAARFMRDLITHLEDPSLLFMEMD